MRHLNSLIVFVLATIYGLNPAYAQPDIHIGLGAAFVDEELDNGNSYEPLLVLVGTSLPVILADSKFNVNAVFDLHYGSVGKLSDGKYHFDIAFNLATELRWQFHRSISLDFSIGSGPAYQSTNSTVQAKGFLFSNNFALGLRFMLFKHRIALRPEIRFRHMSNAGLKSPNGGLDNFFLLLNVSVPIESK